MVFDEAGITLDLSQESHQESAADFLTGEKGEEAEDADSFLDEITLSVSAAEESDEEDDLFGSAVTEPFETPEEVLGFGGIGQAELTDQAMPEWRILIRNYWNAFVRKQKNIWRILMTV